MENTVDQALLRSLGPSYLTGPVYLGQALDQTGQLHFYNSSSTNATVFQAGNASAVITYTLPTAGPAGNNYVLGSSTVGVLSWINAAGTYAPIGSTFITVSSDGTLTNERVLTAGTAIQLVDAGANSTITINNTGVTSAIGTSNQVIVSGATGAVTFTLPQNIATSSNVQFGNLGAGGAYDIVGAATGGATLTAFGGTSDGTFTGGSSGTDADGTDMRTDYGIRSNNTSGHERITQIIHRLSGSTTGQRGGKIVYLTKADGATTRTIRMTIDQASPYVHAGADGDTSNVSLRINGPTAAAAGATGRITVSINGTNKDLLYV